MKITNNYNNVSFNGLLLENKPMSRKQKKIVDYMTTAFKENEVSRLNLCSSKNADVMISPCDDGYSVDLKLLMTGGLNYNYIPVDDAGLVAKNIHLPVRKNELRHLERNRGNISLRVNCFMHRAINCLFTDKKSPYNISKEDSLEKLSFSDFMRKDGKVSRPDLIPDAVCVLGEQQIDTKSTLEKF